MSAQQVAQHQAGSRHVALDASFFNQGAIRREALPDTQLLGWVGSAGLLIGVCWARLVVSRLLGKGVHPFLGGGQCIPSGAPARARRCAQDDRRCSCAVVVASRVQTWR